MTGPPWKLPSDPAHRLEIAKGYPYDAPAQSYLFRDGRAHPLSDAGPADRSAAGLWTGRWAVLGHGSNRAPGQLARKFAHFAGAASEIPVTYVWLDGYDVVYSAHVTAYGAIASNLTYAPGCRVRVALTWLTAPQLARMHETEGAYAFGRLDGVRIQTEAGPDAAHTDIHMYLSDHGCLLHDGAPVGIESVRAEGRPHRALDQPRVQQLVRDKLARQLDVEDDLDSFILHAVADPNTRMHRIRALADHAQPSHVPHFEAV
ncbi:hypothetical protein CKO28_19935 [Rhodovibrio sodomensis]|uniref:Uncharacterized protein n=1 Tax=Rhodovibrio sodomensis TaxID=1088 RepID=A0ABS1DIK6_9PROT|nr:hypothetical protein [Rhodovibrio sodomensis]MBK1670299.1 hypothetical protein [Rhodovibrio sodomensis]